MKTYHKIALAILFSICTNYLFAQASNAAKRAHIEQQIVDINNKLKLFKKVAKTDNSKIKGRNEVLIYYYGSEVKKITATYYNNFRTAFSEYYFANKRLIFCHEVDYKYENPNKDSTKKGLTTEEKIYFDDEGFFAIDMLPAPFEDNKEFPDEPIKETKRLISLK